MGFLHPDVHNSAREEHQDGSELASRTSVSKSAFGEHLRKAENKLLTNTGRFLRLVTATATANPLQADRTGTPEQRAD